MSKFVVLVVAAALSVTGCASRGANQARLSQTAAVNQDWQARRADMLARFPATNPGTPQDRRAYAEALVNGYEERRRELGAEPLSPLQRSSELSYFSDLPVDAVQQEARAAARRRSQALEAEVAKLDGRQVTSADIVRLAAEQVDADRATLRGRERAAAIGEAAREVREAIEQRRHRLATEAAARRETELLRLVGTGLADMPREIVVAAEQNLADRRSPFDTRSPWRPAPSDLRQEEVRLRAAIQNRQEAAQREAAARAAAAQREAIIRQCQMQAAYAGASVPTPYGGRGIGGAIAAGIAGAIQQAQVEAGTLQACLRGAGL